MNRLRSTQTYGSLFPWVCVFLLRFNTISLAVVGDNAQQKGSDHLNRQRKWLLFILSLICACVTVYVLYTFQMKVMLERGYVKVLAPQQYLDAGTTLKNDDLMYIKLPEAAIQPGMVTEMNQVVGMETILPLGSGEPLLSWKLNRYHLMPRDEEATFQLPRAYVLAVSNGVRAGDDVWIYASGEEVSRLLFPHPVRVASVKTANNTEVSDLDQTHLRAKSEDNFEQMYRARREASGSIHDINVNLTSEQWLEIDRLCASGEFRLVIAYSPATLQALSKEE